MAALVPSISRCLKQSQQNRLNLTGNIRPSSDPPDPKTIGEGHQFALLLTQEKTAPAASTPSPREARSEQRAEAAPTSASQEPPRPSLQETGDSDMKPNHCTPLWAHQAQGLDFIADKPGAMLAMEMGTGKTAIAIEHIHRIGAKRTLVFAPLSIVDHVWTDQVKTHSRIPLKVASLGQKYKDTKRKIQAAEVALASTSRDNPLLMIANYESVNQLAFRNWVVAQDWDLIIMDECHRLKAHDGKMSLFIAQLCYQTPRRLGLTGTPMPHSPMDIWAQYRALNVRVFGSSFHRFRDQYAELQPIPPPRNATDRQRKAKQITGYRNEVELREKFRSIAFEVKSEDVLDLPPQMKTNLRVVLNPKARAVYNRLETELVATLESGETITAANALSKLLRLQQVTSGFAVSTTGETARIDDGKAQALEELMEAIGEHEPIVVFARFLHDIRAIKDRANRLERPAWEHSGAHKELDQWHTEGGVIAVQIQAGGTGLDLTFARYCIYYSLGFSLGDYQQSLARLHRPGQERTVYYTHLLTENTVDEKVISSLNRKENVIRSILNSRNLRAGTEE